MQTRRPLGRTGFSASLLGIGDLADRAADEAALVDLLRRALDAGLNVIDTAPNYEHGLSERLVGRAVAGLRNGLFVVTKVDHLDRPVAPQVHGSLGRMGLDAVDLLVFHAVSLPEDWARLAAPGGPMQELEELAKAGLTRFRGVSSHHPEVLREAILSGRCDVVMLPVGPYVDRRYEAEILPLARGRGVGTLAFKTFGAGRLVADTAGYGRPPDAPPGAPPLSVEECLHYTLTVGPDVAVLGLSSSAEQDAAFAALGSFRPLSPERLEAIRARAAARIGGSPVWWNP